jgi:nucleoside-diphosphate-sugar epimerase
MPSETILITGSTGFVGIRIVQIALEAGYRVIAPVRTPAKADSIRALAALSKYDLKSLLELPIVPDITTDTAYDGALKGVTYVIHVASPLSGTLSPDQFVSDLIEPAEKGTTSILNSALKYSNIKRVVITSSVVAVLSWNAFFHEESGEVFSAEKRTPFVTEYPDGQFHAYTASKVKALAATEDFIANRKPHFDIVSVMPSFVLGRDLHARTATDILQSTNARAFGQVLGETTPYKLPGTTCSLEDVAQVHFRAAVTPSIPGNQVYLVTQNYPEGPVLADALEIVKKHYPERVIDGTFPLNGVTPSKQTLLDASKTEKTFNIKFRTYEESVCEIADQYLELYDAERKK